MSETSQYLARELRKARAALRAFESIARQTTALCGRLAPTRPGDWYLDQVTVRKARELVALINRQRTRHVLPLSRVAPDSTHPSERAET